MSNATTTTRPAVDPKQLAKAIYIPLFSSRDSIQEALNYGYALGQATGCSVEITTAMHILLNTIARRLDPKVEDEAE
jgi:hypothetical protein